MNNSDYYSLPEKYRPISMWGYFGYQLLFSIPLIGFICLLVFSFGSGNINCRNFARSYFCVLILLMIIVAVIFAIGGFGLLIEALSSHFAQ